MRSVLLISEDSRLQLEVLRALRIDGYSVWWAPNIERARELLSDLPVDLVIAEYTTVEDTSQNPIEKLRRHRSGVRLLLTIEHGTAKAVLDELRRHVCDFLISPFTPEELRQAVNSAVSGCTSQEIDVVSSQPDWVELLVPCERSTFAPLQKLLAELETDVPPEIAEAINYAFSEMLSNAFEHGCKLDRVKRVAVTIRRLEHAIICRIKNPGDGFDPAEIDHAAIANPRAHPLRHSVVREQKGLRAGGFGILMTKQLVDDLVYNERHNELMFLKFLP